MTLNLLDPRMTIQEANRRAADLVTSAAGAVSCEAGFSQAVIQGSGTSGIPWPRRGGSAPSRPW
jgi:hypothetical protein